MKLEKLSLRSKLETIVFEVWGCWSFPEVVGVGLVPACLLLSWKMYTELRSLGVSCAGAFSFSSYKQWWFAYETTREYEEFHAPLAHPPFLRDSVDPFHPGRYAHHLKTR